MRRDNDNEITGPGKRRGNTMHCGVYCRKSTGQDGVAEDQKSVARQAAHARLHAAAEGWTLNDEHVFVDDGISGAEFANRPSFARLMNALKPRAPFEILIISELSRLGREQIETAYALKQLSQAGVRVVSYLDGKTIALESATDKFLLAAVNFAAEMEREKARQRTYDAMVRKARAGHVTGGATFGYRNIEVRDAAGLRAYVDRHVQEDQAEVIREIFTLYATGAGVRTIAKRLNAEGRLCPRPQQGRPAGWAPSSVWAVLRRPVYKGEIVWGRTKQRDQWGVTADIARAERDWLRVSAPHLRIISDALWNQVQTRATETRAAYLRATDGEPWGRPTNATESKHLLVGFARCAHCGASVIVRSRCHGQHRTFWYACGAFHRKGRAVCPNSLEVRIELANDAILSDIEQFVVHPTVVQRAIDFALEDLRPESGQAERERDGLERQLRMVTNEIGNLTRALAAGGCLPSLVAALQQSEQQRHTVETAITASQEVQAFAARGARGLKAQVLAKVADWRATLRQETGAARQVLRHVIEDRIALETTEHDGQRIYRYTGVFTIGGLFEGFLRPQAVASPKGREASMVWPFAGVAGRAA